MNDIAEISTALIEADKKATKLAKARSESVYQERIFKQLTKDYLASLKMEIRTEMGKVSDTELETRARAKQEWKDFISVQIQELKKAGSDRIRYENVLRQIDVLRTRLSLKKEEIKRFQ